MGVLFCVGIWLRGSPGRSPGPSPAQGGGPRPQVPLPGPGAHGGCLQAVAAGGEGVSAPRAPLHVLGNSSPTFPATRSACPQLRDRLRPPFSRGPFNPRLESSFHLHTPWSRPFQGILGSSRDRGGTGCVWKTLSSLPGSGHLARPAQPTTALREANPAERGNQFRLRTPTAGLCAYSRVTWVHVPTHAWPLCSLE